MKMQAKSLKKVIKYDKIIDKLIQRILKSKKFQIERKKEKLRIRRCQKNFRTIFT
jgi:hypothetical protein